MVTLYDIVKVHEAFQKMKAEQMSLEKFATMSKATITDLEQQLLNIEKARAVVQTVANSLQKSLETRITNIVTMALSAVFDDPYEFKVEFVTRRNQTECDMLFVRNGNECEPIDSSGGGALDIASLALRMAVWSIKKTRAIQVLDEPAKFLSRDLQDKASTMLSTLSDELGIQLILVSHIPEMISAADKVFDVSNVDGYSVVKER